MGGIFPSTISVESILAWQDVCAAEYRIEEDYLCIRIYDRIEKKSYLYMPLGMYSGEFVSETDRQAVWGEPERRRGTPVSGMSGRKRYSGIADFPDTGSGFHRMKPTAIMSIGGRNWNRPLKSRESATINDILSEITGHRTGIHEILDVSSCRDIVNRAFCRYHQCPSCTNGCLKDTIANFLEASDPKGTYGIIVSSNGEDIGYAAGIIQGDTFVFLFKKNCRGYRGLDEYLQTELLKELPEHVRYINYTEDMGVEGLRNYKRRLAPYYLKTRYQVSVERMG